MIPADFIDDVLSRTDIVDIIEPRVALKKAGQNYTGLCPFHNEKTPSFSVSQDKQFYYCFGCQATGSALKFLMEFERLDFVEAVEMLARRLGLDVPNDGPARSGEVNRRRKDLYDILARSGEWYCQALKEDPGRERAVEYLKNRGLTGEIARDFKLGFAPPGWDNLYGKLAVSNHDRELLIESGMVIDSREDNKTWDRFRDRIMFPIRDLRGRIIAFGGRIIGDGKPKYLNSPETPVFHKGRELYGLYEARKRNAKLTRILVVEGYMDVVALAQFGVSYSVATLGTSTTREHIERLFRLVPQIIFCFDGDDAGRNAAWKALEVVLEAMSDGRSARFLFLPDGEDPDSLIRKEGRDRFELEISRSTSLESFFYEHLEEGLETASMEGKAALSKAAMPLIRSIPEGVFKQLMLDELSTRTGLAPERLLDVAARPRDFREKQDIGAVRQRHSRNVRTGHLPDLALSMLVRQPELALEYEVAVYQRLSTVPEFALLSRVAEEIHRGELLSPGDLLNHFRGKPELTGLQTLMEQEPLLGVAELREEYRGTISKLQDRFESQLKQELIQQLLQKPFAELNADERRLIRESHRS